ncbi:MAG: pantetheine-phosphate adenylyltransferase [Bacillota bacterium]|nr:pantetheine-phosphate adenylyltransferase [Bacillota bacterium]
MSKAVFTGSFDPVHLGHLDIIKRSANMYDEITVAVTVNLDKKSMFDFDTRVEMIKEACKDIKNIKVEACEGLRADYVNKNQFDVEVKSLRNSTDFNYELPLAQMHAKLYKNTETVFLMTDPAYSYISSNQVRQVFSLGGDVSMMVHPTTLSIMNKKGK